MKSRVTLLLVLSVGIAFVLKRCLGDRRLPAKVEDQAPHSEPSRVSDRPRVVVDPAEVEAKVASARVTLAKLMQRELPAADGLLAAAAAASAPDEVWRAFRRTPVDIMEYAAWRPQAFDAKHLYRSLQLNPRDHVIPLEIREAMDGDLQRFQAVFDKIADCVGSVRVSEASARLRSGRLPRMTRDLDPELWDRIVGRSGQERLAELTDPEAEMAAHSVGPSLKSSLHSAFMREHKFHATVWGDSETYLVHRNDIPMTKSVLENGELDRAKIMNCSYLLDAFQRAGCLTLLEREELWRLFLLYMEEYKRSIAQGFIPEPKRSLLPRGRPR